MCGSVSWGSRCSRGSRHPPGPRFLETESQDVSVILENPRKTPTVGAQGTFSPLSSVSVPKDTVGLSFLSLGVRGVQVDPFLSYEEG